MTFEETVLKSHPTGSRYICYPPVTNTDNDTVILCNGYYDYSKMLRDDGWENCGEYEFGGEFMAFRKGEENYIITESPDFFNRYIFATEGAKALNLTNKEDRIKLFQAIGDSGEGYAGLLVQDRNGNYIVPNQNEADDFEPAPRFGLDIEAVNPVAVQPQAVFNGQPLVLNQFQALWDRHQF